MATFIWLINPKITTVVYKKNRKKLFSIIISTKIYVKFVFEFAPRFEALLKSAACLSCRKIFIMQSVTSVITCGIAL